MTNTALNLLLITIDCGRQDHIYGQTTETPNIDSLREQGTAFTNAFSQASTTYPSFFSLFLSQYVSTHGLTHQDPRYYRKVDANFLPVLFGKSGWELAMFSGFDLLQDVMIRDVSNCVRGSGSIPVLEDMLRENGEKPGFPGKKIHPQSSFLPNKIKAHWNRRINLRSKIPARKIVEKAIDWLSNRQDRKFFLWTHFFDSHEFYSAPRKWIQRYYRKPKTTKYRNAYQEARERGFWFPRHFEEYLKDLKDLAFLPASYRASLSYIDEQIGTLIDFLERSGEYDKTVIILTADHGENLLENGMLCGHYKLFDQTTKIPLIIKDPDLGMPAELPSLVQHIDVMPTVLDRFELPFPENMQGKKLWTCVRERQEVNEYAFAEHDRLCQKTVRNPKWQYLWADSGIEHPHGIVFESDILLNRIDPGDAKNYAPDYPLLCEEFRSLIQGLSRVQEESNKEKTLSEKWKQRLMALGYL